MRSAYTVVRGPADRVAALTIRILDRLLPSPRPFVVRLWDGSVLPADGQSRFDLALTHPGALRRMLLPPGDLTLGEAFLRGDFEIEGDLEAAVGAIAAAATRARLSWLTASLRTLGLPKTSGPFPVPRRARLGGRLHSLGRDRAAIAHHYDVGNDFYALWLDPRMIYSCAYFPTGTEDLATAQEAKLELICRKLRLRPGERLLDIGCGWGGLALYAAQRYGVDAVGVTLSEPQAEWARQRVADAGKTEHCRIELRDYREVRERGFDKIVSIGMVEHVGEARLSEYFGRTFALLRPGGLFLNHGIAGRPNPPLWRRLGRRASFLNAHVFPDGDLVPIGNVTAVAEHCGFEVRDVESLREHYVRTLRLWVQRLEARRDQAVQLVGGGKYRTWRLFMAASAGGFAAARISVFQVLLAKPDTAGHAGLPWSRADLYA
ncbi:MAG: class I SAM-dependent methyltransferase [bacterium]